jgi:hypothetical protein
VLKHLSYHLVPTSPQAKAKAAEGAKDDDKLKRISGKMYFIQARSEITDEVKGCLTSADQLLASCL